MIRKFLAAAMLGAFFAAPLAAQSAPDAPSAVAGPNIIRMDHISIETVGEGPPVFLIPGLATPREVWAPFVPELARSHRVFLVEVNGFGGSAPRSNAEPGVLDGVVADLASFIGANDLGQPAIVGHSMGGLIGLMLAKRYPDRVSELMVVDSLPFFGAIFGPRTAVETIEPRAAAMRERIASSPPSKAAPPNMSLTRAGQEQVAEWTATADPQVAAQAMYEIMTTDLRPAMTSIETPITMLYPWAAQGVPEARAGALYGAAYADAPNVTLVPVEGSAHFIMLDQPDAFAAAMREFLAE